MERLPVELRNCILIYLEGVDFVHAIESGRYWYSAVLSNVYESKKKSYIIDLKKRKRQKDITNVLPTVSTFIDRLPLSQDIKNTAAALLNSDLFKNLLASAFEIPDLDLDNIKSADCSKISRSIMDGFKPGDVQNIIDGYRPVANTDEEEIEIEEIEEMHFPEECDDILCHICPLPHFSSPYSPDSPDSPEYADSHSEDE